MKTGMDKSGQRKHLERVVIQDDINDAEEFNEAARRQFLQRLDRESLNPADAVSGFTESLHATAQNFPEMANMREMAIAGKNSDITDYTARDLQRKFNVTKSNEKTSSLNAIQSTGIEKACSPSLASGSNSHRIDTDNQNRIISPPQQFGASVLWYAKFFVTTIYNFATNMRIPPNKVIIEVFILSTCANSGLKHSHGSFYQVFSGTVGMLILFVLWNHSLKAYSFARSIAIVIGLTVVLPLRWLSAKYLE